jgi:uncharacterized damage-inducible protein DinB
METDQKADLLRYLQTGRDALVWKLEGLSEYDVRRPLTPTGTNLLGLVKHLAGVEFDYFGEVFGRPVADPPRWIGDETDPNVDMWATPEESRADIVGLYRRAWAHAAGTVAALPLDAPGLVPWWSAERRETTLRCVLVHMIAETHRHAGQADIVREMIDGAAGLRPGNDNLPKVDGDWWTAYRARVQQAAEQVRDAR